ncbi:AsmA family protein [Massilia sp. YIM B02769]|uniref:AsmA family protein n=1 Tax=Massilia sp. YIM B02769 TaxID=3050129 RepID=UPI0025B64363|nr:AsmA family protein [Massilia sp. YIM B02769]MDN4060483.1 AsmA family protein [Massilia sp. YIM B02769]
MPDTTTPQHGSVKPHSGRRKKIILGAIGILIAIPVIAVIFILTFDWNKARPWLNAKVSEAIERPFAIRGNLNVEWEIPARKMAPGDRNLRDWIPWPHLIANDVHVGNPAHMQQADMAAVKQFSFSLNPLGLLHHTIGIPVLRFDAPRVDLVRTDASHYNWVYKKQEKESKWKLDLERIVLTDGVVRFVDAVTKADVTANVRTLANDPKYGVSFEVGGSYNGAPVTGGGKVGQVLSLKDQNTPYPVQADMRSGPSRIAIEGTVTSPARLKAVDLQLELAGRSMARLYNFTGITLPETPAFSTSGRLRGELDREYGRWTYEDFKGKVGSSDIHGKLVYEGGKPRGKLSGNVASNKLVFEDLGPLVGADSNASKKARGVEAVQPGGKVLPVEEFRTERWKAIDADVRYAADRIVREKTLPISKLSAHLIMKDGVITLAPLDFGVAGGTLRSTIRLDGSGKAGNTIAATAKVSARHIQIKQLFPTIEQMQATVGQVNGDAQLSATGTSVAALLGTSNGEVKALVNQGTISKMLLEMAGLNVGNIVLTKLFGDKPVELNCLAADFDVKKGVMQSQVFVVDTKEAIINVSGNVNLGNEGMNLTVKPETKALRLFTLRAPLYVRGTFSDPDVSVDKKTLALKAGGAAALATIAAPVAALLPLINTGPGENSDCARLVALANAKPTAPPPGKTKK